MTTPIIICNHALTAIGALPLEHEKADGAEMVLNVYQDITGKILSSYPWSFVRKIKRLSAYDSVPPVHWQYAWQLPPDRLENPQAYYRGKPQIEQDCPVKLFELQDSHLLCDEKELWARYKYRAQPQDWPEYFRAFITKAVSCQLVLTFLENQTRYKMLFAELYGTPREHGEGGELLVVKNLDAQSQPAEFLVPEPGPLLDARWS